MKRLSTAAVLAATLVVAITMAATLSPADPAKTNQPNPNESRAYIHSNNIPSSGLALEGYCPVAYFAVNKPIKGKPEYASIYKDVTYYFVSADAKKAFDSEPERYVPAYGGWCAFGMAVGDKFPVDPRNFKIVDGRLMLFLRNKNIDALELWNDGDEARNVSKADAYWTKVKG